MTKSKARKLRRTIKRSIRYSKSFMTGYRRSVSSNVKALTRNMLKKRVSMIVSRQRKTRFVAKDVNERLRKLQKWGRYDTWASKQLISRLDVGKLNLLDKEGLINLDKIKYLTQTQLTNVNKAMDQFLKSKTKTIQGINAVVRKKRQDLIEKSDNAQWVKSLTNKEVEDLYRVFDDEEFKNLSEKIKYELIWNKVVEAKQKGLSEQEFIDELLLYTDPSNMNDADMLDSMKSIHAKYVANS